jgi:hypothetical protein
MNILLLLLLDFDLTKVLFIVLYLIFINCDTILFNHIKMNLYQINTLRKKP